MDHILETPDTSDLECSNNGLPDNESDCIIDSSLISNGSAVVSDESALSSNDSVVVSDDSPIASTRRNKLIIIDSDEDDNKDDSVVLLPIENVSPIKMQKNQVTSMQYKDQKQIVEQLSFAVNKMKNFMRSVDMNKLPDKGAAVITRLENLIEDHRKEETKLENMVVSVNSEFTKLEPVSWKQLQLDLGKVEPRTFGKKAIETLNVQKALTIERLEQLHGSLKSCPTAETETEAPNGLKVELMPHQKYALSWLIWREQQKPSGGILADDMGLGKTLTMIALTLKVIENDSENDEENENSNERSTKYPGGTLVVCPASLIYQWESEIKKHVKKGLLTVGMYHGTNRETKAKRLAKFDITITTYALVMSDHQKNGPLFNIKWRRIVADEAHQVRNYKSQTSVGICGLAAKSRWALTGTPIHNKELDLYALLKFLRCSPFDDLAVWKRWVANKQVGGQDRLNTVMSSILLRRTKQQLEEQKVLTCLPQKTWTLVDVHLEKEEMQIYQKVLVFSRTLFAQYLSQRAEKRTDEIPHLPTSKPNDEYFKMYQRITKLNRIQPVKQHEILMLLLRLRQICCHPSLITKMLDGEEDLADEDIQGQEELNLIEQLNKLDLNNDDAVDSNTTDAEVGFAQASRNLWNPSNPVFAENRKSSKVKVVLKLVKESIENNDKIIIISQWKKVLDLLTIHLKLESIFYYQLDGSVPVNKRMEIVKNMNNKNDKTKVLLLSLTAGGVGLNLVGANRLLLIDLHWNPQLEIQAQDRIYRVGQTKPVKIYKLMALDTIEERIKQLQEKKLGIAAEVLTGVKIQEQSKLTLQDLKMLFSM